MSHTRDITVIHTIDKRIFFDIPLYFEKGMLVETVRVEDGRLIVIAKPTLRDGSAEPALTSVTA